HTPTPTPDTPSLHDALPISIGAPHERLHPHRPHAAPRGRGDRGPELGGDLRELRHDRPSAPLPFLDAEDVLRRRIAVEEVPLLRSEEHTSELQSRFDLVCRP